MANTRVLTQRILLLAILSLGCDGFMHLTDGDGPPVLDEGGGDSKSQVDPEPVTDTTPILDGEQACQLDAPVSTPMRRLTRVEYTNAVNDLLGVDVDAGDYLALDERLVTFEVNVNQPVDERLADQLLALSTDVAEAASIRLDDLLACDVAGIDDACAQSFIEKLLLRAFRRPPTAETVSEFMTLYSWGREQYDAQTGLESVIIGVLQSPEFLYRIEVGQSPDVEGNIVPLNDYEIATRLSFLLWQSIPDQDLLDAAAVGDLQDPANVEEHARRMLGDERGVATLVDFHRQWLALDDLDTTNRDSDMYPHFDDALKESMKRETELFIERVMTDSNGSLEALLTDPTTFVNDQLAEFYGVAPPDNASFVARTIERRGGILSQPSWLALNANANRTSTTFRGLWIRENLLCQSTPPPPADQALPDQGETETTRQRFEQILDSTTCGACHKLMDPIGFGFENLDAIGQWRDEEAGQPIDASGEIVFTADADGTFNGPVELGRQLANSDQVRDCVTKQYFRYAFGRLENRFDECTLETAHRRFAESGWDLRELLIGLTQTDAFYYRANANGAQ